MSYDIQAGLLPYSRIWAITPDWKRRFANLSPQLYAALRDNPARFAELSRAGVERPAPALALGLSAMDTPTASMGGKARRNHGARNPAPLSDASHKADIDDDDYPDDTEEEDDDPPPYDLINGVALLSISGPMTKKPTSAMWLFGGTSTLLFRRKLAHAVNNKRVGAILIDVDSPGGSVAGTADLADDLVRATARKPVEAFVPDLCASAAFWAISGVRRITAGRAALVGSIGIYMVVEDFSKMYTEAGIEVFVFRSGAFKGAGEEGTALTEEQQADFQREVDDLNQEFAGVSVKNGRGMTDAQVKAVNTGQVWKGQQLIDLKLVDEIGTYEGVLTRLATEVQTLGLASIPDVLPGMKNAASDRATLANRLRFTATTAPLEDAVALLHAADRLEAEAPAGIMEAAAAGRRVGGDSPEPTPGTTPAPTATGTTPDDPPTPETEPTPGPTPEPAPAGDEIPPVADGEPAPAEPAANTTEETETMGNEPNTTNNAAGTLDPALVAALTTAGITTAFQLTQLAGLAADGKKARTVTITSIANYTTRLEGAEATDPESGGTDAAAMQEIYGAHSFDSLLKIEARLKQSYEAMMKHPAQASDPANNPAGTRITQPTHAGMISPAIVAGLQNGPQGSGQPTATNPTGTGLPPINPDDVVARLNKGREAGYSTEPIYTGAKTITPGK